MLNIRLVVLCTGYLLSKLLLFIIDRNLFFEREKSRFELFTKVVILSTNYSVVILFLIQFCSEPKEDTKPDTEVILKL